MFPKGLWRVSGVVVWLWMTGFWLAVVAIALWALTCVLPTGDRSTGRSRADGNVDADDAPHGTTR